MKKIGITGGIGAGKSYVCKLLTDLGYPVFNADNEAKKIMQNDQKVVQQIKSVFGEESYIGNQLNREYLATVIFSDNSLKEKLNKIVHPAVILAYENWCKSQKSDLVFNEIAILFEMGRQKDFDHTILVTAPEEIKIDRVIRRDNTTREEVKKRMDNQWSDEKKIKLASFTIENDGKKELLPQIESILTAIEGE